MKQGTSSISFSNVYLHKSAVVVGPKEHAGPLSKYFDKGYDDMYCSEKTWEKAEMHLFKESLELCLQKNFLSTNDIDLMLCGDLNNQIIIGSYCLRDYGFPYLGIFSACSSFSEAAILGSILIDSQGYKNVLFGASSHNATAERQFRYPLEYGGQKPDSFTFTVTASGIGLLSSKKSKLKITRATIGRVKDSKINDPQDMGRVMAIAAYDTLKQHLSDFKITPEDYDLIITGDLSKYGKDMLIKYLELDNIILDNYWDCGTKIFDPEDKTVCAGGSGCGCVTAVTLAYICNLLENKVINKVLVIATGALMNPIILAQKETIPSIAHAFTIERSL